MYINNFFSSEIKKFMDTERLDEKHKNAVNDKPSQAQDFAAGQYTLLWGGTSSSGGSATFGGGVTGGNISAGSIGDIGGLIDSMTGNAEKEKEEPKKSEPKRTIEKTKKEKEKIRTGKETQGERIGNKESDVVGSLSGHASNDVEDKYYKTTDGGYIPVQSSNLKAVKYDPNTKQLNVQFLSGSEYSYDGVIQSKYNNLMGWSSHGSYFYWNIRGKGMPKPYNAPFSYRKI